MAGGTSSSSSLDIKCAGRANQGNTLNQDVVGKIVQLSKVSEAVYKKDLLIEGDVIHGAFFKTHAAKVKVYLEKANGKIKTISLLASYDAMGMSGTDAKSVKGTDLIRGKSLGFSVEKGLAPILKITAGKNFSLKTGGILRFNFWNGNKYESVKSRLIKDKKGKFKIKLIKGDSSEVINYLAVNVRGLSASSISIHDYQVSKR